MLQQKPWTVMVYLAADNNLDNFGVDSLRQMKAAATDKINIVAQFDTGPMNPTRRYYFDGTARFGPLDDSRVEQFSPTHAGDPENLSDFIVWAAQHYPAGHYLTIIWGHGGGIDDDFPQAPDNSFVPRHSLLNFFQFKGTLDFPQKGTLDFPQKGTLDFPQKGTLDFPQKGTLDFPQKNPFDLHMDSSINVPRQEILQAVQNGFERLHSDFVAAIEHSLNHLLDVTVLEAVVRALREAGIPIIQSGNVREHEEALKAIREKIICFLKEEDNFFKSGTLDLLQQRVAEVLENGVLAAFQSNNFFQLQKDVLEALDNKETRLLEQRLHKLLHNGFLQALQNGILQALKHNTFNIGDRDLGITKSLAFVDHPATFLSNVDLKKAIERASHAIQRHIDVVGFDSCNMNMVEIGYELSDVVDFMVASQASIPDASWPYGRILARLGEEPEIPPAQLASLMVETYVIGYTDYFNQSVALSALDLRLSKQVIQQMASLVQVLAKACGDVNLRTMISNARENVRMSFGQDQFIDIIEFCGLLSGAKENLGLARAASDVISAVRPFIAFNKSSAGGQIGHGTSIYFPRADRARLEHQQRLGLLYAQLDFAKMTGWGGFVDQFVRQETAQVIAAQESDRIQNAKRALKCMAPLPGQNAEVRP